jgi:NAD(P)-dependent dehydrogenase (short-subunit alcohol dehydrogenase family)
MPLDDVDGRIAVVTGAASGIGLALTRRLVGLGATVIATDVQADRLDEATADLGDRVEGRVVDVSSRDEMMALADQVFDRHGTVHILANNAGVTVRTSLLEATQEDWEWVLGVNVWGVINGIEAFVPRMIEAGEPGQVVNTCSMAGFLAAARYGIYCATKHAVAAISESLAGDLAAVGAPIGVTAPCPSAVATNFSRAEDSRPARYGAPAPSEIGEAEQARIDAARDAAQSADDVVDAIMAGVRDDELFVFPDATAVAPARDRMTRILGP